MILFKLFIKRLILSILLVPLIILPTAYILIQTKQGAIWINQILSSSDYNYQITIDKINLALTHPLRIELKQLVVKRNGNDLINVNDTDVIFRATGSSNWLHYLEFRNGTINVRTSKLEDFDLNSEWLILKNIDLNVITPDGNIVLEHVNSEVSPWSPKENSFNNSIFQMSALKFTSPQFSGKHLLIVGRMQRGKLILDTFGANLPHGEITGRLFKDNDNDWVIENLYLNKFRWQGNKTLPQLYQQFSALPPLNIRQLDIIGANVEGDQWALNEANLSLENIKFKNGQWTTQTNGKINFMADSAIFQQVHIEDPIIKLKLNNSDIEIQKFNARWQDGLIKVSGVWNNNILTLDDVIISAIEYTLPENWRSLFSYRFPDWLQTINVDNLKTSRNVIIDTNKQFPFQLTFLDIDGNNLRLVQEGRFNLWYGDLTAYAHNATFNQVDIRYPFLAVSGNEQQIYFSKLSAFIDSGIIDGQLILDQTNTDSFRLEFNGDNVPVNLLHQWGWQQPLSITGKSNIKLSLGQKIDSTSVSGILEVTNSQGQKVTQHIPRSQNIDQQSHDQQSYDQQDRDQQNSVQQNHVIFWLNHFIKQAQRISLNSKISANIASAKAITSDNLEVNNTNAGPGQMPVSHQPMPNNALPMIRGVSIFLASGS